VGRWAKEKHEYLRRYIGATWAARKKFLVPSAQFPKPGGAAFVDLFAGPGRARIRDDGEIIDGSPLIALKHPEAPFTKVILCDLDEENVAALRKRVEPYLERATVIPGDCNSTIDSVIQKIPPFGLNIALIDPYGLRPLSYDTWAKLAQVGKMDLLFHFPTGDIKRNLANNAAYLDRFLGTQAWRPLVRRPKDVVKLIDVLRNQLQRFGYTSYAEPSPPVRNVKGVVLYHLVYASKHPLGSELWGKIAKTTAKGQRHLGF
jgi:three-Cys-motif partner protein